MRYREPPSPGAAGIVLSSLYLGALLLPIVLGATGQIAPMKGVGISFLLSGIPLCYVFIRDLRRGDTVAYKSWRPDENGNNMYERNVDTVGYWGSLGV